MQREDANTRRIQLVPAELEQEPVLANLLELYAHDFSEFHDVEIGADGRFGYRQLSLYWREPHRHPFFIMMDEALAGLALVKRGSEVSVDPEVWDMAEFFVLRRYRRRGFGTAAASAVWRQFPGLWEVRVMQSNASANLFWASAIFSFSGDAIHPVCLEKNGDLWNLYKFESKGVASPRAFLF